RNRFSHKFWYYPDKYDSLLCSGCGRCIVHCPTRIDIREVLRVMGAPAVVAPLETAPGAGATPAAAPASAATEGKEA
ncbi:MAG: 4Fe-4S dicluster domain-containing protein, partial [bacterium]